MIEFICEGCAVNVYGFGRETVPAHQFCATCEWIERTCPPEQIMELRRRCEPGGWQSERAQRAYRNASFPERSCDRCGTAYRGPAVYCSLNCAVLDA